MLTWLKNIFSQPKNIIKLAVDALDLAAPPLAKAIDQAKDKFNKMSSEDQAKFAIDWIQAHLRQMFKIEPPSA